MATTTLDVKRTTISLPPESLGDNHWSAASGDQLSLRKQRHVHRLVLPLSDGLDVGAITKIVHAAKAKGKIIAVNVTPNVAPIGAYVWTADVKKSTAGGAFASILVTTEDVDSNSVDRTPQAVALAVTTYGDDDVFQIVVTISGASGTKGQGGCIVLWLDEEP